MAISEFQLALIGAGAAGVVGVWAYNAWQEYRQRKPAEKPAGDDVPIETATSDDTDAPAFARVPVARTERVETRIEPVFNAPPSDPEIPIAESAEEPEEESISASEAADDRPDEECLDPMIELGMALPPEQSVVALQAAWRDANAEFRKSVRWIGRDKGNGEWIEVDDAADADHAFVAIQLADRQGPIEMNELSAFCATAEAIAASHGGRRGIPALDEILAHARAIDGLCADVDIQIAIHIVAGGGQTFTGTKLRGLLEARGLQLAPDGLFHLLDDNGKHLLSVSNAGAAPFDRDQMRTGTIAGVTFWLDVPCVEQGGRVFDNMLAIARQVAAALDGVLVDDQRNPLADNVLASIRAKVVELQTQMASHGIPAGGRRALRLFA